MEILLWLVPAALVTALAAWGAAVAARREEAARERAGEGGQAPAAPATAYAAPSWQELDLDDGVSAPRPARRPTDPAPRQQTGRDEGDGGDGGRGRRRGPGDGPVRRSA